MYHNNYNTTTKTSTQIIENCIDDNELFSNKKEIYKKEFKKLFNKTTRWSDNTQDLVIELLEMAGIFEENFMKDADIVVKKILKNLELTKEEYGEEYYLNYLQYVLQNTFFNRNVNGKKVERWQTKPQKFYTKQSKNKIKKMLYSMPEFVDEVKIDKNVDYDYYVVLGAVIQIMRSRLNFVLDNIKNNKERKIIILTSNRQVFLKNENDENNKKLMDLIKYSKSLEEIVNTDKIKLTNEQKEVLNYYINNKFSIDRFREDWEHDILTEEGMGQIIMEEKINKIPKNVNIITLETVKNGKHRANTVDTVRTLVNYLGSNDLKKVIFITTQPSCPSQYSQIKTNFGDINIAAKKVRLNDDVAKILIQNIAESFNNYYLKLTRVNKVE